MIDYHVAVISYRRADRVRVFGAFPSATLYVPESQVDEYRRHNPHAAIVAVPDDLDGHGTLAPKINWILDQRPSRYVVRMDDDVYGVGMWERDEWRELTPDEIDTLIVNGFEMAEAMGAPIWGLNLIKDKRAYSVFRPLKLLAPICGPFSGHILEHGLRYDPRVGAKEDYDFWLLCLHRYRRTLRLDKYHYLKREETRGGLYSQRTLASERADAEAIQRKWGSVIRYDESKKNLLDGRVAIPIQGC